MIARYVVALPWLGLIVVALTLLPVLDIGFLADDWLVASRIHWDQANASGIGDHARAIVAPTWPGTYQLFRPASLLLMHVEWRVFGPDPRAFHMVSLVLWLATTLAVASVVRRLLGTRAQAWPALTVLLFGAWPAGIEALTWGAAQADLLSLLWSVCALRALLANRPTLTTVFVALAMLSKETAIVLPVLLLLLDRARANPSPIICHVATFLTATAYLALRMLRFGDIGALYRGRTYVDLLADRGLDGVVFEVGRSLHRLAVPLNDNAFTRAFDVTPLPVHIVLLGTTVAIVSLLAWIGDRRARRLALGAAAWTILPLALVVVPLDGVGAAMGRSRLLVLPAVGWVLIVILGLHRTWESGRRRLAASLGAVLAVAGIGLWRVDLSPYAEATRRVESLTTSLTRAAVPGTRRVVVLGIAGDGATMHTDLVSFDGCHLLAAGLYNVARPPFVPAPGHAVERVDRVADLAEIPEPPHARPAILHLDTTAVPPTFIRVAPGGRDGPPLDLTPGHGQTWKPGIDAAFIVSGPAEFGQRADVVRIVIAEPEHGDHAVGTERPIIRDGRFEVRVPVSSLRARLGGQPDGPRISAAALQNVPGGVIVWWAELLRGETVIARSAYRVVAIRR